jgi:hypothetical protein
LHVSFPWTDPPQEKVESRARRFSFLVALLPNLETQLSSTKPGTRPTNCGGSNKKRRREHFTFR